jgi:hypothetical protein
MHAEVAKQMVCTRAAGFAARLFLALAAISGAAHAQVIFDNTSTVSSGAAPIEQSIVTPLPGTVTVTLTDLGTVAAAAGVPFPVPLTSLNLAVTNGGQLVTSRTGHGQVSFPAVANGTYVLRIVGQPNSTALGQSGAVSVLVQSGGNTLRQFTGTFQTPQPSGSASPYGVSTQPFNVASPGDCTLTLTDQKFPAALAAPLQALVMQGTTVIATITVPAGSTLATPLPGLASGAYQVFLFAEAAGTPPQGLYGVQVTPSSGSALLDVSVPVAALRAPGAFVASAGAHLTLTATDLQEPAALAALGALVTNGSATVVGALGGAGPQPFTSPAQLAPAGLQVWTNAQAAAGNAGAYSIAVAPAGGGQSLYSALATASASSSMFAFVAAIPAAGSYDAVVTDLEFPAGLATLTWDLYQGGTLLTKGSGGASGAAQPLKAEPAVVAVTAMAGPSGSGLFAVALQPSGGGAAALDTTQAVTASFLTQDIVVTNGASYDFTLTDLGWPANFGTLEVAVTQSGKNVAGKIYGGGTFTLNDVAPGRYVATIVAVPAAGQTAGLYNLGVQESVPTVTVSASPTSIPSGQGTRLTWSSTNATSCEGSGGWSGNLPPSGSNVAKGPLMATTTYTLVCSGSSGKSKPASATVTVTSAGGGGGGGGGGVVDELVLAALSLSALARAWRASSRSRRAA